MTRDSGSLRVIWLWNGHNMSIISHTQIWALREMISDIIKIITQKSHSIHKHLSILLYYLHQHWGWMLTKWLKVVSPCQLYFPMVPWSLAIIRQRQREPETPERNHGVWASLPDTPHWGPLPAVNTDTSSAHSVCFSSSMTTFTFLRLDCIVWKSHWVTRCGHILEIRGTTLRWR